MMTAAHSDSPSFKIKENAELPGESDTRLSVEGYGGMLCASWMDRPLSICLLYTSCRCFTVWPD